MSRRLALAFLLLAPLTLAGGPFSEGQTAFFPLDFEASSNFSSIFAYFPENWSSPSPSEFACPADWIRDADTTRKAHCACAAPCQNLLSNAGIALNTTAPAAGAYAFRLLAFAPDGILVSNQSQSVLVQTPADIVLLGDGTPVLPSGLSIPLNLTLQNIGQAGLSKVRIQIQSGLEENLQAIGQTDVSDITGGANASVSFGIQSNQTGRQPLSITVSAQDANSGRNLSRTFSRFAEFRLPANVSLTLGLTEGRFALGQPVHVPVLLTNKGQAAAQNVRLFLAEGEKTLASLEGVELLDGEKKAGTLDARFSKAGVHDLAVVAEYRDALSGQSVSRKASLRVSVVTPSQLSLSAEALEMNAAESRTLTVALSNAGTEAALNASTRFLEATGGCRLVGADAQFHGEIGEPIVVSDWTILAPEYGSDCQLFLQASGTDALLGQAVQSPVLRVNVRVNPKRTASFGALSDARIHFEQTSDGLTVLAPQGTDWTVPLSGDAAYARLVAMVRDVADKQDLLEAKVDRLMLYAQTRDQTGGNDVSAQLAVQLARVPAPSASVDVVLLPSSPENDALFGSVAKENGVELSEAAAVLKVDKTALTNQDDVAGANVTFRVPTSWVDGRGGPLVMQAFRSDGDALQMLTTSLLGQENGDYLFLAQSPDGLSLYALYALKRAAPDAPSGKTGLVISGFDEQAYAGIAFVLIIAGYFYVTMRTKKKENKQPLVFNAAEKD